MPAAADPSVRPGPDAECPCAWVPGRSLRECCGPLVLDGVTFASSHGDDLALWAIFERAEDPAISRTLDAIEHHALSPEHSDLQEALRILGLRWSTH